MLTENKKIISYVLLSLSFLSINAKKAAESDLTEEEVIQVIKQDKALLAMIKKSIDDILQRIQYFTTFVASHHGIIERINAWLEKNAISHMPKDADWHVLNNDLQQLISKLVKTREQDPRTKAYKYLAHIIGNTELSDLLIALQKDIYYPISFFTALYEKDKQFTEQTKQSLLDILNNLAMALYKNNVLEKCDELFKSYETTAEEIKQEIAEAEEKALVASEAQEKEGTE